MARDHWASLATLDHLDQLAELDLVDRVVLLVGDLPTLNRHVTMIRTSSTKWRCSKHSIQIFVHSIVYIHMSNYYILYSISPPESGR